MARPDVDAKSPGFLEKSLERRDVTPSSVIDSLRPAVKKDIADACAFLVFMLQDQRLGNGIRLLLDEMRRTLRLKNDTDLSHDETQRLRGQIDGLTVAENLLTDPVRLGETQRQMLGIPEIDPQGVADA